MPLCDTALRLVQRDLYALRWTDEILDEALRNLISTGRFDKHRLARRFDTIRQHFADGEVRGYEDLIPVMRCDPKDRHVLAAAVAGGAHQIVTANVRDFPEASIENYEIEVVTPDRFLLNGLDMAPAVVIECIHEQAAALSRPAMSVANVLAALSKAGAPDFAHVVEDMLLRGNSSAGPG